MMFHKRCQEIEAILREENESLRNRVAKLEEALDEHMAVPVETSLKPGRVIYMDDAKMAKMEES